MGTQGQCILDASTVAHTQKTVISTLVTPWEHHGCSEPGLLWENYLGHSGCICNELRGEHTMYTRRVFFECNIDAQAGEIGEENCDRNILDGLIMVS
jgi:hypothetical protein